MYTAALPDSAQQHDLEPLLSHLEWAVANPYVLTIGSGALNEAYHYLETYGFSRLQIDCIDLASGAQVVAPQWHNEFREQIRWETLDLAQVAPQRHYHLIWSSDLFDAVDDQMGKRMLAHLLQAVTPGGAVVLGSMSSAYRLRALASACGVPTSAMTLRRGPDGMKLFLHIRGQRTAKSILEPWSAPVIQLN